MFAPQILLQAALNGLLTGAVYALIALGLTLVYGVLHIINFAHGALLTVAMFAVWGAFAWLGVDPYLAMLGVVPAMYGLGYATQRYVIDPAAGGDDNNGLLVTLGLSIVLQNGLLALFRSDTRTIDTSYAFQVLPVGPILISVPRLIGFCVTVIVTLLLWWMMRRTDTGRAIRAAAKERLGADLVGIEVGHIHAVTFGIGCACLGVAACLLMPTFYVSPNTGAAFVLVAFTIVVLGGMGSVPGALLGGLLVGVVESFSSLLFGDSLGQVGIFILFILVLLFRPTGLFGARA